MLESFHFIRPWWLLGLMPLSLLAVALLRRDGGANPWGRVVEARLLPLLMMGRPASASHRAVRAGQRGVAHRCPRIGSIQRGNAYRSRFTRPRPRALSSWTLRAR